ncbi:MAG: potassium channel family protein [Nanoarchaeota archaeon]|nr:potassium channel family protein [Nanoarchaeota archaeon]
MVKRAEELKKELKRVQEKHEKVKKEVKQNLTFAIALIFLILLIGTVFFYYTENLSLIDSFYFSGGTITTLGYGDIVPTKPLTKIFVVFYTIFSLGIVLYCASIIASKIVHASVLRRISES